MFSPESLECLRAPSELEAGDTIYSVDAEGNPCFDVTNGCTSITFTPVDDTLPEEPEAWIQVFLDDESFFERLDESDTNTFFSCTPRPEVVSRLDVSVIAVDERDYTHALVYFEASEEAVQRAHRPWFVTQSDGRRSYSLDLETPEYASLKTKRFCVSIALVDTLGNISPRSAPACVDPTGFDSPNVVGPATTRRSSASGCAMPTNSSPARCPWLILPALALLTLRRISKR